MASDKEAQWRMAGDRIQTLLDSCAAGGTAAQERAQQLVREVVGLYGAGLERIMEAGDPGLAERLATDDLVASLLLVHGLHPHDVHRRVSDALDRVRPYLGSHGGDVDLLGITDGPQGARVLLAFKGSCKSCPSSAVTLELAVQDAVRAAAPEVSVDRGGAGRPRHHRRHPGRIPAGAPAFEWPQPFERARHLVRGSRAGRAADRRGRRASSSPERTVLACRVDDRTFAYRDHCPVCDDTLAGALAARLATRCPGCDSRFDVVHAGAGLNAPTGAHLDPLPLLARDGVLSVALRPEVTGAPA